MAKITYVENGIQNELTVDDSNGVSDGNCTFGELYENQYELFIALCRANADQVWRSTKYPDGTDYEGFFVLSLGYEHQIAFSLPLSYWDATEFAETLETAPAFQGFETGSLAGDIRAWVTT